MAGGGSRASWFVEGARRRGWWWSRVSGFVMVGARRHSWVVGRSLSSMGWRYGRSLLFVLGVSGGVRVVDVGGRLWWLSSSSWAGVSRGACVVAGGRL